MTPAPPSLPSLVGTVLALLAIAVGAAWSAADLPIALDLAHAAVPLLLAVSALAPFSAARTAPWLAGLLVGVLAPAWGAALAPTLAVHAAIDPARPILAVALCVAAWAVGARGARLRPAPVPFGPELLVGLPLVLGAATLAERSLPALTPVTSALALPLAALTGALAPRLLAPDEATPARVTLLAAAVSLGPLAAVCATVMPLLG